jgi:HSP20 family protein
MQEDMDRAFGQFFAPAMGAQQGQSASQPSMLPSMDVGETDKEIRLEVDLPGFKGDDINVEVQDGQLMLRAETQQKSGNGAEENRRYHRRERRYGFFEQVIPLPQSIDEEKIKADFRDGVLTISIPKSAEQGARSKRIPIGQQGAQQPEGRSSRSQAQSQGETGAAGTSHH